MLASSYSQLPMRTRKAPVNTPHNPAHPPHQLRNGWRKNGNSKRRARFEPGSHDLLAGGEPHAVVGGDVAERLVEPGDAVRHADQVGMQADRHDPTRRCALGVERIELALDRRDKLVDMAGAGLD